MGRVLVPATMLASMLSFAVAAMTAGIVPYRPSVWPAAVTLAVLGGITPMIYAVNIRIVPVFARRAWSDERWLQVQVALAVLGAWAAYIGRLTSAGAVTTLGSALALGGAIVFLSNLVRLMRRPPTSPPPPLPYPGQAAVDRLATRFTRLSVVYLVVGLVIGLVTSIWPPASGRWDLVWAHALLIGFFLSMAAGVSYHVLSRWTGRPWRSVMLIRVHLLAVALGLPLMLLGLATANATLIAVAGVLQAAAVTLFLLTIAPMVPALPGPTRTAVAAAGVLLLIGVGLGAVFAIDPAVGARLRIVHAQLNLFGWTGLLISGVGYYLVPRFAGQPLRWPYLATIQLVGLGGGVVVAALAWIWRIFGNGPDWPAFVGQGFVVLGFALFGVVVAGTFHQAPRGTTAALPLIRVPDGSVRRNLAKS